MDILPAPEANKQGKGVALERTIEVEQLLKVLLNAGVPVEEFGTGVAKTVHHLLAEVQDGESIIKVMPNGEILRELSVVWVDVSYVHPSGDTYRLREDRQEFKDGRVKRRILQSSLGEKLKPEENPEVAVFRALEEELGVTDVEGVEYVDSEEKTLIPDTYPGVTSSYKFYKYATTIGDAAFKPEGYIEEQSDKTNYYVWELLRPVERVRK